jgi:hypothetical protein
MRREQSSGIWVCQTMAVERARPSSATGGYPPVTFPSCWAAADAADFVLVDDFERGASYTLELVLENQSQRFGCVFELVEHSLAALG